MTTFKLFGQIFRNYKNLFIALLSAWFLVNFMQSIFTEVISDEAYYYQFGKNLAWGYFDHPPMVALLVRLSSLFFDGNLGIRLMTIFLQIGTLIIIWKIIDVKDPETSHVFLFFIIANSLSMFTAYGFFTTPDAPLLFFTALFLLAYKKFLENESFQSLILLSISMAGLVYSKYQSVLVIGFVLLSNIKLLKSYKFWLAGLLSLILLSPHIYWQVSNNFPSLKYHLVDRSEGFRLWYIIEYIPNQMAVFNPFTLGAVVYLLFRYKSESMFEKALYFLIIGFLGFFWLTSIRGHVEPHWTVACSVPMIVLLFWKSCSLEFIKRFVRKVVLPSLAILFVIRILLISNLPFVAELGFNGKKERYEFIELKSDNLPVVFLGSFQGPSLYNYFTGKETFVISSLNSRQTQFDIWKKEMDFQNKKVFLAGYETTGSRVFEEGKFKLTGYVTDSLQTTNRIKLTYNIPGDIMHPGDSLGISVILNNPCNYDLDFNHSRFPVRITPVFVDKEKIVIQNTVLSEKIDVLYGGDTIQRTLKFVVPQLPDGRYSFGISLNSSLGPTFNSKFVKVKIVNND